MSCFAFRAVCWRSSSALLWAMWCAAFRSALRRGLSSAVDQFRRRGPCRGILDWYTISVGVLAFTQASMRRSLWVALKTEDPVSARARRIAGFAWIDAAILTVVVTYFTMQVQPHGARQTVLSLLDLSGGGDRGSGRGGLVSIQTPGSGGVSIVVPLHRRNAVQRRLRIVSLRPAIEYRSAVEPDHP